MTQLQWICRVFAFKVVSANLLQPQIAVIVTTIKWGSPAGRQQAAVYMHHTTKQPPPYNHSRIFTPLSVSTHAHGILNCSTQICSAGSCTPPCALKLPSSSQELWAWHSTCQVRAQQSARQEARKERCGTCSCWDSTLPWAPREANRIGNGNGRDSKD